MKKLIVFFLIISCATTYAEGLTVGGKRLVVPQERHTVSGITAASPAVVSFAPAQDGPECVADGGFDDPTKWGVSGPWVVSGSSMTVVDPGEGYPFWQAKTNMLSPLVIGKHYIIIYEVITNTLGTIFKASSASGLDSSVGLPMSVGWHTVILQCVRESDWPARFFVYSGTGTFALGSLSIKQTEELWKPDAAMFESGTYGWTPADSNTIANVGGELQVTYVNSAYGANIVFTTADDFVEKIETDGYYIVSVDAYYSGGAEGSSLKIYNPLPYPSVYFELMTTAKTRYTKVFKAGPSGNCKLQIRGMSAGNVVYLDNLSLKPLHDFSAGDFIALSVPEEQTLGPDIPRTFVTTEGNPIINGDSITFFDEVAHVRDYNYWTIGNTYLVNCTVSNFIGDGHVYMPYTLSSPKSFHEAEGNGVFQYAYTPTLTQMGVYSNTGHTCDVTVNWIKRIFPVNGQPYRITSVDTATGACTIDADFSGLASPVTSGVAFRHSAGNYKNLDL